MAGTLCYFYQACSSSLPFSAWFEPILAFLLRANMQLMNYLYQNEYTVLHFVQAQIVLSSFEIPFPLGAPFIIPR